MNWPPSSVPAPLEQLHQTYCRLTGQNLAIGFDRERLWFEFHRAGFTLADLVQVVRYLQKEIRHTRRNVGALKLSNLLQLDRFEEDLNISRVRLSSEAPPKPPVALASACSPAEYERGRQRAWFSFTFSKKSSAKDVSDGSLDFTLLLAQSAL